MDSPSSGSTFASRSKSPLEQHQQSNSPTDRVFQFISDPKHRENLSGRVRAACVTCRRKKIKCSGELNCQTCREKGIVCEGLPDRKRPRRAESVDISCSPSTFSILDPVPAGVDRIRRLSTSVVRNSLKPRPASLLRLAKAMSSCDSGYASVPSPALAANEPSIMGTSPTESTAGRTSPAALQVDVCGSARELSPLASQVDIWDPETASQRSSSTPKPSFNEQMQDPKDMVENEADKPLLLKRYSSQDEISWWNKTHHRISPSNTDLSTAARFVFGDSAQPVQSNLPKASMDLDGMPIMTSPSGEETKARGSRRRESIQFPIPAPKPFLGIAAGMPTRPETVAPVQQTRSTPQEEFDAMALLLPIPVDGATPSLAMNEADIASSSLTNSSTWWKAHSDLHSLLSQTVNPLSNNNIEENENPPPPPRIIIPSTTSPHLQNASRKSTTTETRTENPFPDFNSLENEQQQQSSPYTWYNADSDLVNMLHQSCDVLNELEHQPTPTGLSAEIVYPAAVEEEEISRQDVEDVTMTMTMMKMMRERKASPLLRGRVKRSEVVGNFYW